MKKVYIAGCGGMLGRAVYEIYNEKKWNIFATDINVNENWLEYGDVSNYENMKDQILEFNPNLIINLAAKTDLEWCELNQEETYKTNALGAENLGIISNSLDIPYIFISTAGVFDGKKDFYTEFDIPNPINLYGVTKYYGEKFTSERVKKHYIFRPGWMMGGGKKDKKFVSKIYKKILNGNKELFIVDDKLGTPTYTKDFALNMYKIIEKELPYGLYNMVCEGDCSRYDVAVELIKVLKLNDIKINRVNSDYWQDEYFAKRPESEKLKNLKLNVLNFNFMRNWKNCLEEYLKSDTFQEIE